MKTILEEKTESYIKQEIQRVTKQKIEKKN